MNEEAHMRRFIIGTGMIIAVAASPAWALFETNKELISNAKINVEDAIRNAIKEVPGRAAEADLGKNDGKTVWKIEIIDKNNKSQTVYVDAQTGMAKLEK
jgi:uncharacterized membrane protein YkoI